MLSFINRKISAVIIITAAIVSFLLFNNFGESDSRLLNWIINFGHFFLFGSVALVCLWVLNQGKGLSEKYTIGYLKAWAATSVLGVTTELIQALTSYRHCRLTDMFTDALGAAVFLLFTYSSQSKSLFIHFKTVRNVLLILIMIRIHYFFILLIDTWNMETGFPVLSSFETPFEMSRYSNQHDTLIRSKLHATEGEYSLETDLKPGLYPGISMNYLHNDWIGYTYLSFDVFLEGTTPLDLTIRINDRKHNNEYRDRFNRRLQIVPGNNHISLRLNEVKIAPHRRVMDMADITNICIFSYKLKAPRTIYFDNFKLDK